MIRVEVISRQSLGLKEVMEQVQMVDDRDLTMKLMEEDSGLGYNKIGLSKTPSKEFERTWLNA